MKLTPEQEKWLAALESGGYKQIKRTLRNMEGYCCLGVACDVFDNTRWHGMLNEKYYYEELATNKQQGYGTLTKTVLDYFNFYTHTGEILREYLLNFFEILKDFGYTGEHHYSLTEYNDYGATFFQLAKAIRKLPEAVFKESF